jgi:hypothetical protein
MMTNVAFSAFQLAVSALTAGGAAAVLTGPGASGNKACEMPAARTPMPSPTPMATASAVLMACSRTPATGMIVMATTRNIVNGFALRASAKNNA